MRNSFDYHLCIKYSECVCCCSFSMCRGFVQDEIYFSNKLQRINSLNSHYRLNEIALGDRVKLWFLRSQFFFLSFSQRNNLRGVHIRNHHLLHTEYIYAMENALISHLSHTHTQSLVAFCDAFLSKSFGSRLNSALSAA